MNVYVFIVVAGLVLKLWVAHYALNRERVDHKSKLNGLIILSAVIFSALSIPQFFLLADGYWAMPFGLPRYVLLRWYLFHGVLCITVGFYFVLSVFSSRLLEIRVLKLTLIFVSVVVILTGARYILFSELVIESWHLIKQPLSVELGTDIRNQYLIFIRTVAVIFFSGMFFIFLGKYKRSSDTRSQIINLYALIALALSVVECVGTVFLSHPILFSVKGVFFTIVVFLACSDRKIVDVRHAALITLEAKTSRDIQRIFRVYANDGLKHKEAMMQLERTLVSYKLNKVSGFRNERGSSLPDIAENMGVKLSTLYELIKRLGLSRPTS